MHFKSILKQFFYQKIDSSIKQENKQNRFDFRLIGEADFERKNQNIVVKPSK